MLIEYYKQPISINGVLIRHLYPQVINSNQFQQWNRIPQIWPRLEDLRIRRPCTGLTMTMLANILPQFNKLKSIALPCEFMSKEARLSNSLREQLSRRRPPIDFGPCFWYLKKKCPYVDELEEAKEESNRQADYDVIGLGVRLTFNLLTCAFRRFILKYKQFFFKYGLLLLDA